MIQTDKGQLFENAIALELQGLYGQDEIKYWRTTNQTERDFISRRLKTVQLAAR